MKLTALLAVALAACVQASCPRYQFTVFTATSSNAAGLAATVKDYQNALGGINNVNELGPIATGFRQINWDAAIVPFDMPGNFFNVDVPRGALFKAKGGKFAVSNPANPPPVDNRFSSLLPLSQTSRFQVFSPERLFTPVKKNKVTVLFRVPGSNKKATVTGFAAIFTDVVRKRKTSLKYFDKRGCLIAKVPVPPQPKGLTFTGIVVLTPGNRSKLLRSIFKVKIKVGTVSVADFQKKYSGSFSGDVVVMDDFIYGEPN